MADRATEVSYCGSGIGLREIARKLRSRKCAIDSDQKTSSDHQYENFSAHDHLLLSLIL